MKKVLLSIDEGLLRRVDRAANAAGVSRSAWIAQVAASGVERERLARARRSQRAIEEIRRIVHEADPTPRTRDAAGEVRAARAERADKLDRLTTGSTSRSRRARTVS